MSCNSCGGGKSNTPVAPVPAPAPAPAPVPAPAAGHAWDTAKRRNTLNEKANARSDSAKLSHYIRSKK